jgi:hypothetical protein
MITVGELLKDYVGSSKEKKPEYLKRIAAKIKRLGELLDEQERNAKRRPLREIASRLQNLMSPRDFRRMRAGA